MVNAALSDDRLAGRGSAMSDRPAILCGVDDSGHAFAAARVADELATWLGAQLVLVHVVNPQPLVGGHAVGPAFTPVAEVERAARAAARSCLAEVAERIGRPATPTRVEVGPIVLRLEQAAVEEGAALVVVGTRGAGDVHAAFLGSVSGAVLRSAPCPTVVVPPAVGEASEPGLDGERIVCAVRDGRDGAAVERAATLAVALGVELTLAHVLPPGVAGATEPGPVVLPAEGPATTPERLVLRQLHALRDGVLARHAALNDRCRVRLRRGRPAQQLDALCEEERAALIVLGPQRRGPMRIALLGSIARDLARHGTRPVVNCPQTRAAAPIRPEGGGA